MYSKEELIDFVRDVKDPEIDASIVDIGLVYDIQQDEYGVVNVLISLTSPGCPFGDQIVRDLEDVLGEIDDIKDVDVKITFDPMWGPERFSDELKLVFGYPI